MKLLECETLELLERLCMMKEYFDEGCTRIVEIFKDFNEDFDECEAYCMEAFYDVCKYVNYDELHYEDETDSIDDYSEAYGEVWTFSSDEMRAFYRLLAEFPPPVYQQQCKEMQSLASEYIMAAQDAYHVGGKYDRTMPADGAIFEMNENGGEISIALTDMTSEEIRAVHEGELKLFLSEIDGIVFVTAVFDGALAFDMPFNAGLYPEWRIEDPAPYGYFYLIAAVERRTNVITALRAGAFDPQFSAKLYALARRQWEMKIEDYDAKLAAVYARYSTADIIRRAIARNEVKR